MAMHNPPHPGVVLETVFEETPLKLLKRRASFISVAFICPAWSIAANPFERILPSA